MFHTQVHHAGPFFTQPLAWNKEHAFICSGDTTIQKRDDEIKDILLPGFVTS